MTSGCQVDFYVLGSAEQSAQQLACRLAMMAWEQGYRIAVMVEDQQQAHSLDELMWELPAGRFLPHALDSDPSAAPVRIGTTLDRIDSETDVIINLTAGEIREPERFKRLLEIVPANEAERAASRIKFRAYRNRNLDPVSHPMGKSK